MGLPTHYIYIYIYNIYIYIFNMQRCKLYCRWRFIILVKSCNQPRRTLRHRSNAPLFVNRMEVEFRRYTHRMS